MKLPVAQNSTGRKVRVLIVNATSSTGGGLTGLTYNSAGLTWYYFRDGDTASAAVAIVAASLGTYTSGGFVEVDSTNMPGVYEIGVPTAVFAKLGTSAMVIRGAANAVDCRVEFDVTAVNDQDGAYFGTSGLQIAAAGGIPQMAAPTIAQHGATGTTTAKYQIVAVNGAGQTNMNGGTSGFGIGVTTTSSNVLSGSVYNILTWAAAVGASSYNVWKLSAMGVWEVLAYGVTGTTYNDTGGSLTVDNVPYENTTSLTLLAETANLSVLQTIAPPILENLDAQVSLVPAAVWNVLQSAIAGGATMGQWLLSLLGIGTGQYQLSVSLVDSVSNAAIVGGRVAVTGAAAAQAISNGSGVAAVNLNSGTYEVSAIASGYENATPAAQVVNGSGHWVSSGSGTLTIAMTAVSLPYPAPSGTIWGLLTTCNQNGAAVAGVKIQLQMTAAPAGDEEGLTFPTDFVTYTSDGSGHLAVLVPQGATFVGLTSKGKPVTIDVPASGSSFAMPTILGQYS